MSIFAEPTPTDRIHAIVEEFYKNYKPEFVVHTKLEKAQVDLLSVTKDVFSGLRSDFKDRKEVYILFEYKEKCLLEEIDRKHAARANDLE